MFEQESYSFDDTPAEPLREGDLFYQYEIGRWSWSRRIYSIIGISALINLLAFGFVAQTNILTARGCDGPIIGRVCQVIDMAYVGTLLFGTDREIADVEYTRTQLGEADEVVWIDQTGIAPQLEYPEGYFQIANPEQAMLNATDPLANSGFNIPGIPSITPTQPGRSPIDTPQYVPKKNKNAVVGDDVDSPFADDDTTANSKSGKSGKPDKIDKEPKGETTAENDPSKVTPEEKTEDESKEDKNGVALNKRPLRDKAKETLEDLAAKKIELDKNFKVTVSGTLAFARDGKTIVLKDPKPVPSETNPQNDPLIQDLVQDWILAVGDSGWLGYLEILDLGKKPRSKKVIITVEQNDSKFVAILKSEVASEADARRLARGLSGIIQVGAIGASGDELLFLKSAIPTFDKNQLILNVDFEKPVVQEMIKRKLDEAAAENKNTVNSNFRKDENTAAKE